MLYMNHAQTDDELFVAYLAGDLTAFNTLFNRHAPTLHRTVNAVVGGVHAADDVVQDVFLSLHQHRSEYKPGTNLKAWLYRIAYNNSITKRRLSVRRREVVMLSLQATMNESFDYEMRELRGKVVSTINGLFKDDQESLRLYFYDGLTYEEIGKKIGTKSQTAKTRVSRALSRFKRKWVDDELQRGALVSH